MKLPDALVERAAKALEWESNCGEMTHAALRRGARAALEAALGQCEIISFGHSMRDEKPMKYEGKRVALVVLDD